MLLKDIVTQSHNTIYQYPAFCYSRPTCKQVVGRLTSLCFSYCVHECIHTPAVVLHLVTIFGRVQYLHTSTTFGTFLIVLEDSNLFTVLGFNSNHL